MPEDRHAPPSLISGYRRRPNRNCKPPLSRRAARSANSCWRTLLVPPDETLAGLTHFGLDAQRWKAFMEALDAPPRDISRLGRLLQEPSVLTRRLTMADPLRIEKLRHDTPLPVSTAGGRN